MKLHEPIGHESYGPFLVRVALGMYILLMGYSRIDNVPAFVDEVKALNVLPLHLAQLAGMLLPYLAILAGLMLVLGIWTTLAAIVSTIMIGGVIWAMKEVPHTLSTTFSKDLILLAASISLLYSGSGAFSFDKFRKLG